jgi:hypothetical protein
MATPIDHMAHPLLLILRIIILTINDTILNNIKLTHDEGTRNKPHLSVLQGKSVVERLNICCSLDLMHYVSHEDGGMVDDDLKVVGESEGEIERRPVVGVGESERGVAQERASGSG